MPVRGDHNDVGNNRARPATGHSRCAATGLGLASQLCDLAQIYSYSGADAIRLRQNR
jgi:hypothetical protein